MIYEKAREGVRAFIRLFVWPIAAAVLLLLTFYAHTTIVREGLAHLLGDDQPINGTIPQTNDPLVASVVDGCGRPVISFAEAANLDSRLPIVSEQCRGSVSVTVREPARRSIALFHNWRLIDVRSADNGTVAFDGIRLHSGPNHLAFIPANDERWLPYGTGHAGGGFPAPSGYIALPWFPLVAFESVDPRGLIIVAPEATAAAHVGEWSANDGGAMQLYTVPVATVSSTADAVWHPSPSGLFLAQGPGPSIGVEPSIERHLTIARAGTDMTAEMDLCLPESHFLAARAKATELNAFDLAGTLFGLHVATRGPIKNIGAISVDPVQIDQPPGASCVRFTARIVVPAARFELSGLGQTLFPNLPGDVLRVSGFPDAALFIQGRVADDRTGGTSTWKGGADHIGQHFYLMGREPPDAASEAEPVVSRGALVLSQLRDLPQRLGLDVLNSLIGGISKALPLLLVLWAVTRSPLWARGPASAASRSAGYGALAVLVVGISFAPLLFTVVLNYALTPIRPLAYDGNIAQGNLIWPIVVTTILLAYASLSGAARPGFPLHRTGWAGIGAAAVAIIAVALAVFLSMQSYPFRPNSMIPRNGISGLLVSAAWLAAGLLVLWLPVLAVMQAMATTGPRTGTAVLASALIFYLPMAIVAGLGLLLASRTGINELDDALLLLTQFSGALGAAVILFFLLDILIASGARLLPSRARAAIRQTRRSGTGWSALLRWVRPLLAVVALVAVLPQWDRFDAGSVSFESPFYRLLQWFVAYAPLVALIGAFALVANEESAAMRARKESPFDLAPETYFVCTAIFAAYLTAWDSHPVSILILIGIGWLLFRHLVLDWRVATAPAVPSSTGNLAEVYLQNRRYMRLFQQRQAANDKKLASGEMSNADHRTKTVEIRKLINGLNSVLPGQSQDVAIRQVLGFGPRGGPLPNGLFGLLAGVGLALVIQVFLPYSSLGQVGSANPDSYGLFETLFSDPRFRFVPPLQDLPAALAIIPEFINSVAYLAILGFLFGYCFHAVRGRDGFSKAMWFGAAIVMVYLLAMALAGATEITFVQSVTRLTPVIILLVSLGLVFDLLSIRQQGLDYVDLPEIYGLTASVSYVAIAGAFAGVQPTLALIDWIVGSS